MNVASDLVDTETTREVATLVGLFLQLVCPTFLYTLPRPINLGLSGERLRENVPT